jgi:hypothetical protein
MTLTDLHLMAARTSNVDADTEFKLFRALLSLFPLCRTTRCNPPKPVARALSSLRRLDLSAPLAGYLEIALGREGATS